MQMKLLHNNPLSIRGLITEVLRNHFTMFLTGRHTERDNRAENILPSIVRK